MTSHPIPALYLGGHTLTREAMRAVLARAGIRVSAAVSIQDAVDRMDLEGPFQVALVDDDALGEALTLEAVETLAHKAPDCPVAVLSASRSPVFPADVLRAGAAGYLSKESGVDELRRAIARIAQGQVVVDPMVTRTLLGLLGPLAITPANGSTTGSNGHEPKVPHLSGIERRVLTLVAEGKVNKQIGAALGLSPLTIKNHLARIRARLGAGDKAQAVAIAMRSGLLE
jgi:DNA-binding NarL/FixJ family response regulator